MFGRAFIGFVIVWVAVLYTFGVQALLPRRVAFYGLLLSPALAAGSAMLVAWLMERRIEARYRRETEDAQRQRAEANLRLMVLQAQLEPHFLFNTLASLRALLRENVDQAEHLVDALVSHLRSVLPAMRSDDGVSTLSDQLAICTSYLELMSIRLDGQLKFRINVPGELMQVAVPPLMLLTLVENAIKHGIEPKPGGGCLCIRAERTPSGEGVNVSVSDDGIGLVNIPHKGLGLKNLREQLVAIRRLCIALTRQRQRRRSGRVALHPTRART